MRLRTTFCASDAILCVLDRELRNALAGIGMLVEPQ